MKGVFFIKNWGLFLIFSLVSLCLSSLLLWGIYYSQTNVEDLELALLSRELGLWDAWMRLSISYDGRYLTNLLQGLNPLVFNNVFGYKWMILGAYTFFIISIFLLIRVSFNGLNWYITLVGTLGFSVLYFQNCGSLAYALYWMGSSFVYLYPSILFLLIVAFFVRYLSCPKPSLLFFIPLAAFLFLGIGCSELYLPLYLSLSFLVPVFFRFHFPELVSRVIPLSLVAIMGIWFMVSAPGLGFRFEENDLGEHLNFPVILSSLKNYGKELGFLFNIPVLLLMLLSGSLVKCSNVTLGSSFKQFPLGYSFVIFFLLPYLMTLPYFITKASTFEYPVRVYIPVIFIQYFFIFFILVPTIVVKYPNKLQLISRVQWLSIPLSGMILIQVWCGYGQIGLLFNELCSGSMERFDNQLTKRYTLLEESRASSEENFMICTDTLQIYPRSLYTHPDPEFHRDSTKWHKFIEGYFEIREVRTYGDTVGRFSKIKLKSP